MAGSGVRSHRWSRIEYERLVDVGIFKPGENLELLDGLLVVRGPQNAPHATAVRAVQEGVSSASRIAAFALRVGLFGDATLSSG